MAAGLLAAKLDGGGQGLHHAHIELDDLAGLFQKPLLLLTTVWLSWRRASYSSITDCTRRSTT